jgi:hypothetical protein
MVVVAMVVLVVLAAAVVLVVLAAFCFPLQESSSWPQGSGTTRC